MAECTDGTVANDDLCEIVDSGDRVVGVASRSRCHGDPELVHRAAHVLVLNARGGILLQKRAADKRIQPGRWDSSVGGHLAVGETYRQAAVREMEEELGLSGVPLTFLFRSRIRNDIESENIAVYLALHEGPFDFCRREISEVRFWHPEEVERSLGRDQFTPHFEEEWQHFLTWQRACRVEQETPALCSGDTYPNLFKALYSQ